MTLVTKFDNNKFKPESNVSKDIQFSRTLFRLLCKSPCQWKGADTMATVGRAEHQTSLDADAHYALPSLPCAPIEKGHFHCGRALCACAGPAAASGSK